MLTGVIRLSGGKQMDAQAFWNVIGNYNEQTVMFQIGLLVILNWELQTCLLASCFLHGMEQSLYKSILLCHYI